MTETNNYQENITPPQEIPLTTLKSINNNGKEYTIIGNQAIEEVHDNFNTKDELLIAFKKIQRDSLESKKFNTLSPEDQQQYLIEKVVGKWRIIHRLERASKQSEKTNNKVNTITTNLASNQSNDVLVNSQIGIIKNDNNETITKIEEKTDENIQVTETNIYGTKEINNSQSKNQTNSNSSHTCDSAYLSSTGIENPPNNNLKEFNTHYYQNTPIQSKSYVRKKILQPNNYGRPGYINIQMIIIILTLSTIIGITIGYLLYINIY